MGLKNGYFGPQMDSGASSKIMISSYSLLLTCLIFLLAIGFSSTTTTATVSNTTESGSTEVLTESTYPDYEDINITVNYQSNAEYDPTGLSWLYSITKSFMNAILEEVIPEDVISIKGNNEIKVDLDGHVSDILAQYAYAIALCVIIVIFAVAMLLAGLCFNCCCLCGCCGDGPAPDSEKSNSSKKICLFSLLIICGALILFGGVCAFSANERLKDGVGNFPEDMRTSIRDTELFLNTTVGEINILLGNNLIQLTDRITNDLNDSSVSVQDKVNWIIDQMNVDDIFAFADQFGTITASVLEISTFIENVTTLTSSLREVYDEATEALEVCTDEMESCISLQTKIADLNISVPASISEILLATLTSISNIPDTISNAKEKFSTIKDAIPTTITTSKETATTGIKNASETVKQKVEEISSEITNLESYLPNVDSQSGEDDSFLGTAKDYIDKYDPYRHNVGLAICCILFCIVCLLAVGITCGFGKNNFFNRGGRLVLLCGSTLMFYLTIFLAAIILLYFLVGMIAQQAVCKSLRDPSDSRFFDLIDQFNLSDYGLDTTVSQILSSMQDDESAYNVFNLKSQFDIDSVKDYLSYFQTALDEVEKLSDDINFDSFTDLTTDLVTTLNNIEEPNFSNFDDFLTTLGTQIQNETMRLLIVQMELTYAELEKYFYLTAAKKLKTARNNLRDIDVTNLPTQISTVKEAQSDLESLDFETGRNNLTNVIKNAQNILTAFCPKLITEIVDNFANKTLDVCENYLDRVIDKTKNSIGKCGPLGVVYDATLTSVCDKVALQVNSFWFVLLWTMLMFLPTIVISVKLANIYKSRLRRKPTEVETVRLPTENRPKRKKPKRGERETESPNVSDGDPYILSRNVHDIPLDKWEQYPPLRQPHTFTSGPPEILIRPPPYFFGEDAMELRMVGRPQQRDERDTYDDLNKWRQYPERNNVANPTQTKNRRFV